MESLIHIAHKEVYTKVIHANMMIPQIETRVRIQVALEFFFHITSWQPYCCPKQWKPAILRSENHPRGM